LKKHFLTEEVIQAWGKANLSATDPSLAHNAGVIGERLLDVCSRAH